MSGLGMLANEKPTVYCRHINTNCCVRRSKIIENYMSQCYAKESNSEMIVYDTISMHIYRPYSSA